MRKQTIYPSNMREGKLRCKTCENLYARSYYTQLEKKGCHCGQKFEIRGLTQAEINKAFTRAMKAIMNEERKLKRYEPCDVPHLGDKK